jgi:hypothetical protein
MILGSKEMDDEEAQKHIRLIRKLKHFNNNRNVLKNIFDTFNLNEYKDKKYLCINIMNNVESTLVRNMLVQNNSLLHEFKKIEITTRYELLIKIFDNFANQKEDGITKEQETKNIKKIKFCIELLSINMNGKYKGYTLAQIAERYNLPSVVEVLIELGCKVPENYVFKTVYDFKYSDSKRNNFPNVSSMLKENKDNKDKLLEIIRANKINFDFKYPHPCYYWTPLCDNIDNILVFETLLECGVVSPDEYEYDDAITVLSMSLCCKNFTAAKLLVDYGADVNFPSGHCRADIVGVISHVLKDCDYDVVSNIVDFVNYCKNLDADHKKKILKMCSNFVMTPEQIWRNFRRYKK